MWQLVYNNPNDPFAQRGWSPRPHHSCRLSRDSLWLPKLEIIPALIFFALRHSTTIVEWLRCNRCGLSQVGHRCSWLEVCAPHNRSTGSVQSLLFPQPLIAVCRCSCGTAAENSVLQLSCPGSKFDAVPISYIYSDYKLLVHQSFVVQTVTHPFFLQLLSLTLDATATAVTDT